MTYYHWGDGSGSTAVWLDRSKVGAAISNPDSLFYNSSSLNIPTSQPPGEITTATPRYVDSDMIVRRGYKYFVNISGKGEGQKIGGVKIFYRRASRP